MTKKLIKLYHFKILLNLLIILKQFEIRRYSVVLPDMFGECHADLVVLKNVVRKSTRIAQEAATQ